MRFIVFLKTLIMTTTAVANDYSNRDLAVLIHNRIAGVPPTEEVLKAMVNKLEENNKDSEERKKNAAEIATNNPAFYSVKLFNLFSSWTNVAGSSRSELNDMTATLIGIVRDNKPFTEALTGNYLYTGEGIKTSYSPTNNQHYKELQKHDLKDKLTQTTQKTLHTQRPFDDKAIAGILSSRAFAQSYYSAGTNRRATAFVLKYFLCHDMESLHDIKDVDDSKVRKDVSRSPGGDPQLFRKRCVGCHAGMDALSGWNLYHDWDFDGNKLVYDTAKRLTCDKECRENIKKKKVNKINFNDAMDGDVADVSDDSFTNIWTTGQNASLGWDDNTHTSGNGAKEWGQMIANSKAFASCMATHAYQHVCMVTPTSLKEKNLRDSLAEKFRKPEAEEGINYNMKKLFAITAAGCLPGEK